MAIVLAYCACALVWGTTWLAIRACIAPGGYPSVGAAALRFSLAGAVLLALWVSGMVRPGPRTRRELGWTCLAGALDAGGYGLVYCAVERISGGLAAVLFGSAPLMMAAVAWLTRTERASPRAVVGAALAVAGISLIFADRLEVSASQALGVGLALGSVVLSCLGSIVVKRRCGGQHPLALAAVFLTASSAVLWTLSAAVDTRPLPWPPPPGPTAALVYLALVGSVLVFGCYFFLLARVRLMTISTLALVQPLIALALDAVWEVQIRLSARSYVGAALVLGGLGLALFARAPLYRRPGPALVLDRDAVAASR
ncbi:MAG: EamA family transporter [Deltaproteobacteria bacterium]|nr:EamA family transporter [Deltaproteobacteria bacterium]